MEQTTLRCERRVWQHACCDTDGAKCAEAHVHAAAAAVYLRIHADTGLDVLQVALGVKEQVGAHLCACSMHVRRPRCGNSLR